MQNVCRSVSPAKCLLWAVSLTVLWVVGGVAPAEEPTAPSQPTHPVVVKVIHAPAATSVAPAVVEGARVYRDPATGELGPPSAAQRGLSQRLEHAVSRSSAGLSSRALPQGGLALDLQGRFLTLAVARRSIEGALTLECADNAHEAAQLLAGEEVRDDR